MGELIIGTNVVCDLFASTTDLIGECARVYESKLAATREAAMNQVQEKVRAPAANAVVGIDLDHGAVEQFMAISSISGTEAMT